MTPEQQIQNANAMLANANGKPIEARSLTVKDAPWHSPCPPSWSFGSFEYRPKPEPVTRPWRRVSDVPGPVCWIRKPMGWPCLIVEMEDRDGIVIGGGKDGGLAMKWSDLSNCEYSTDRKTWLPCTVKEEA